MAKVAPPGPLEAVPSSAQGKGVALPSRGPVGAAAETSASFPRDFPRVNPLVLDVLPLLFSCEADRRRIEKVVVVASDMGFEELKPWVSIFSPFCLRPVTFVLSYLLCHFMLQSFATFSEMCSQIDIGNHAKKEVVLLRDKVKERESLVAATTAGQKLKN